MIINNSNLQKFQHIAVDIVCIVNEWPVNLQI